MRLPPPMSQDEAYRWLKEQVERLLPSGTEPPADLETNLQQFADAMAMIGAVDLPDDVEPLFP